MVVYLIWSLAGECPALTSQPQDYDGNLQNLTSLHLPAKQLIVNDLTHKTLQTKLGAHRHDLVCIDGKLDGKKRKYGELEGRSGDDAGKAELRKLEIKAQVSQQPIRTHYLDHVTGYQPIRDQYSLVRVICY